MANTELEGLPRQLLRQALGAVAQQALPEEWLAPPADRPAAESDDTLVCKFMCCHPSLSPASQIALTLRAGGGLTTAEVARAFLAPEATMIRRISRAVLHVLHLIFNEGYASTSGPSPHRGKPGPRQFLTWSRKGFPPLL